MPTINLAKEPPAKISVPKRTNQVITIGGRRVSAQELMNARAKIETDGNSIMPKNAEELMADRFGRKADPVKMKTMSEFIKKNGRDYVKKRGINDPSKLTQRMKEDIFLKSLSDTALSQLPSLDELKKYAEEDVITYEVDSEKMSGFDVKKTRHINITNQKVRVIFRDTGKIITFNNVEELDAYRIAFNNQKNGVTKETAAMKDKGLEVHNTAIFE